MLSEIYLVYLIWDTITLLVCLGTVLFFNRLRAVFRGGAVGKAYSYYLWAGLILSAGLAIRVVFDLMQQDPHAYGISVRDTAIILTLLLLMAGLRTSTGIWRSSETSPKA